jgi:vacuolar-type H+-ATPase subunit D/Vma8
MNTLNKFHREILISDLSDLIDKKESLKQFGFKIIKDLNEATTQQRQDVAQASLDINELQINFIQDQIERIKEILVDNLI